MPAEAKRPFIGARSRVLIVDGEDWDGACKIELLRERWLSRKTNRYVTVWSARRAGRLGWESARTPRSALARAGFVKPGTRPRWLTEAVRAADELSR